MPQDMVQDFVQPVQSVQLPSGPSLPPAPPPEWGAPTVQQPLPPTSPEPWVVTYPPVQQTQQELVPAQQAQQEMQQTLLLAIFLQQADQQMRMGARGAGALAPSPFMQAPIAG